ncbi:MAG: hypothetical protein JXR50_04020 [Prolixibacteraceae bacterium]|nr:hypothetical protein [Prolixibacteraceae bacterium]MBN2648891.1 hypothetical protein [Prolixibacteraceae bacterium]
MTIRPLIYKIAALAALLALVFISLGFVSTEKGKIVCVHIDYVYDEPYRFVDDKTIGRRIESRFNALTGALIDTIDTEMVEIEIEKLAWIRNAEVFKGYGRSDTARFAGGLKIYIAQEEPVLRIVNGADGYYVNRSGKKLPFSSSNTANVLVATGSVTDEVISNELLVMVDKLSNDVFLSSLFQQIDVQTNGELILVPRVGNHIIEFGTVDNMDTKFRNLEAVYKKGFNGESWNKYKSINLKYKNQVVCTHR